MTPRFLPALFVLLVCISSFRCKKTNNTNTNTDCYKGRLEVKGICANYTIALLQGNLDTAKIEATWKDEVTGKSYVNVLGLGSPCTFPDSIKAGDEFYFTLSDEKQQCAVCMAYYPTPQKKLSIKVLDGPCK